MDDRPDRTESVANSQELLGILMEVLGNDLQNGKSILHIDMDNDISNSQKKIELVLS